MAEQTPEQLAEALVTVGPLSPGGPVFVRLHTPEVEGVDFGPYDNSDLARGDAAKARKVIAAAIRAAGGVKAPHLSETPTWT